MFNIYRPKDKTLKDRLENWRLKAAGYSGLAIFWAIVTPLMAARAQYQVPATVMDHWLVAATIGIWPYIYAAAIATIFVLIELINAIIVSDRSHQYDERVDKMVARLSKKAGLPYIPEVIYIPTKHLINAGAGTSYLFGHKIVLFGDIIKLSDEQLEAVLAHEIAHLRMGDVRLGHFLGSLILSLRVVNMLIFIACAAAIFSPEHDVLWFLAVTYIITLVGSRLARYFQLKVSRICEYQADALAIDLTSAAHRQHLVDALKTVRELSLVVALRKSELNEIDSGSHPTLRNRARSLGLFAIMRRAVAFGS